MVKQVLNTMGTLVEEHQLVRRVMVVWIMTLITGATVVVFSDISKITGPAAAAYGALTGLLSVPLGLYHLNRARQTLGGSWLGSRSLSGSPYDPTGGGI